jgi:hypothetical protein
MLDFKNYNTWMYKFEPVFDNYDYKKIVKKFKNNKEVLSIHDITDVIGNEIRDIIRKRLHNTYDYIVFYHGTATNNIFSYLEKGLLPLDIKERNLYARKLFNLKEYPEITDDIFIEATKKQFSNNVSLQHREKRLFLTLDDNILKEESSGVFKILCQLDKIIDTGENNEVRDRCRRVCKSNKRRKRYIRERWSLNSTNKTTHRVGSSSRA